MRFLAASNRSPNSVAASGRSGSSRGMIILLGLECRTGRRCPQSIGDGAVGGDAIRNRESQNDLGELERRAAQQRVALVDQIEDRPDDQRHHERSPRYTLANAISSDLTPSRHRKYPRPCSARDREPVITAQRGQSPPSGG